MKCFSSSFRVFIIQPLVAYVALNFHSAAWADFDDDACAQVAGTDAIHWEDVLGNYGYCEEIEYMVVTEELDGSFTLNGDGVSGGGCISNANYNFELSQDALSASGSETDTPVEMQLVRESTQECFMGHWTASSADYVGHFPISMFELEVQPETPSVPVTTLPAYLLFALSGLLALFGFSRVRASK